MAASARYPSASRSSPTVATARGGRRASSLIVLALLIASAEGTSALAAARDAGKPVVRERVSKSPKVAAVKPAPGKPAGESAVSALAGGLSARGLTARSVALGDLLDAALGAGHDVLVAKKTSEIAASAVENAASAFDPVLSASLNYSRTASFKRGENISRPRDQDPNEVYEDSSNDDQEIKKNGTVCQVTLDGETYSSGDPACFQPPVFGTEYELASSGTAKPGRIYAGSIGLSWTSPFGLSSSLSISARHNHKYSFQTPALTGVYSPYDPFGWGDRRFWTSSASLSLSMPLPYTKGFGWDGSATTLALRSAESNERAARAAEASTRNAILGDTASAYWDLVLAAERLKTVAEQRSLLKERRERARRLVAEGRASDYDVDQVNSALVALDRTEEENWTGYLVTANRLATLTGGDRNKVIVPADADALLAAPLGITADTVFSTPPEGHPDVKVTEAALETARNTTVYRENQTGLDLSLAASLSLGESDAAYGYKSLGDALGHLTSPDTTTAYVGLRLVIPLGDRKTEAALTRAKVEESQARDRVTLARRTVVTQTENAAHNLNSANAQIERSRVQVDAALIALDAADAQIQLGKISQYELLNKLSDLLTARLNLRAAQVAARKAVVAAARARGTLEEARFGGLSTTGGRP